MTPEQANDADSPRAPTAEPSVGVLAALPRTRPHNASPRRAAARARSQSETAATAPARGERAKTQAKTKLKAKSTMPKATPKKKPTKRRPPVPAEELAPKQGYEPEEEIELGNTVHPPSGGELIESLADIVGELVSAGARAGGRLLKDALSIFRRS
jgi:hypothetical protein